MRPFQRSIIAGCLWGCLAAMIFHRTPWYGIMGAVLASPFIGMAVYIVSKRSYSSRSSIALWAIPSVYFAVALFSLSVGLLDSIKRGPEIIFETFAFGLYGITVPSPFWLLYPLAFVTHLWVRAGEPTDRDGAHSSRSNHVPDPTFSSGTSRAGHESRHR
jgi:hypothetical protein